MTDSGAADKTWLPLLLFQAPEVFQSTLPDPSTVGHRDVSGNMMWTRLGETSAIHINIVMD